MLFLTSFGVVFGRGGVGFLLASALAGAKAEFEKLSKSIGFYSVICLRPLRAHGAENEHLRKSNSTTQEKRTPRALPKSNQKRHLGSQNGSQNRSREPLLRSWRPVSRKVTGKVDPKTRPRALLGAAGVKENIRRPKAAPKTISQPFFAVLKTEPHPGRGGAANCAQLFI